MHGPAFELIDFIRYLQRQWLVFAISCGVAAGLALVISLVLPREYTASADVLIQPPGGNDPRAATAVSPVYLESLKAYENIASSDRLFVRALDQVRPPEISAGRPIEVLKKSMLKIAKPLNTAVLEISVTSTDPESAHAMAQFTAEQTVQISRTLDEQSEEELTREFRSQMTAAEAALAKARAANGAVAGEPIEALQDNLQNESDLKGKLADELALGKADLAGYEAELRGQAGGNSDEVDSLRRQKASSEARIAELEKQQGQLSKSIADDASRLEEEERHAETLTADERSAQTAYDAAVKRLNESLASTSYQGERLRVMDPGIVPQAPSSPDIRLNVIAALILALAVSFAFVMVRFTWEQTSPAEVEFALRR